METNQLSEDVTNISGRMEVEISSRKNSRMIVDGFIFEVGSRYRLAEAFTPSRSSKALKKDSLVQLLDAKSSKVAKVFGVYEGQTFEIPWAKLKKEEV